MYIDSLSQLSGISSSRGCAFCPHLLVLRFTLGEGTLIQAPELTRISVACILMDLGAYPMDEELLLKMLGMHDTVLANYAVDKCELLLVFGVRFDDMGTGKLGDFASWAKIVHIDIDAAESLIRIPVFIMEGGAGSAEEGPSFELQDIWGDDSSGVCNPDVDELHMEPRQWLSSVGLGAKGFGHLRTAGAAFGNLGVTVVDIDDDGSFLITVQELEMICIEKLSVKIMLLNNQHLGIVVQRQDRFYKANRAHTYLGEPKNALLMIPNGGAFKDMIRGFSCLLFPAALAM
ncbi:hypothetical protein M5K25_002835 [Dendrobium thyrsiflorum]|uniref:Acetolactate synthase n=1 Tax=Dendrobium thyrsiflorum TaxID=117978 RepID=A0ABD0VND4_DENTH